MLKNIYEKKDVFSIFRFESLEKKGQGKKMNIVKNHIFKLFCFQVK